jgi:predicted Zn-dependent protease
MPLRRFVFLTLVGVLAVFSTGCSLFKPSDQAVIAQAQQVHGQLQPAVIQDPEVQRYMDQIGQRIIQAAQEYAKDPTKKDDRRNQEDNSWLFKGDIRFHLVNSKTLNAFTTGGQHVYIYNELLQKAQSEDELAAVMAHEFAHIYCRHVAKGMTRQTEGAAVGAVGALAGAAVGGNTASQVGGGLAGAAAQFLNQGFTRGDEDEADKYGFSFYIRAGWDPQHFADFFQRMIDMGLDTAPQYASDHPTLASRVAKTQERVAHVDPRETDRRRRPPIADAQQFRQVQQRAVAAARNTPDDKSLAAAQLMLAAFPSCVAPVEQPQQQRARSTLLHQAEQADRKR